MKGYCHKCGSKIHTCENIGTGERFSLCPNCNNIVHFPRRKKKISEMTKQVTLADFEVRYQNLRRDYPNNPMCSVEGCPNPVDVTEGLGIDTTCAYHRLLFDFWFFEVIDNDELLTDQVKRRKAFKKWIGKTGKEACDKLVLGMAKEKINWMC
jgi:hypothetical protein